VYDDGASPLLGVLFRLIFHTYLFVSNLVLYQQYLLHIGDWMDPPSCSVSSIPKVLDLLR
jgi:hypothetical protein